MKTHNLPTEMFEMPFGILDRLDDFIKEKNLMRFS